MDKVYIYEDKQNGSIDVISKKKNSVKDEESTKEIICSEKVKNTFKKLENKALN